MGKILKDITRYLPQDKVNFFIKNLPKECQDNFDITLDFLKKLGFSELLDKVNDFDVSQSFYTYRDNLVNKTKSNFEKIDAFVDTLPLGNRLQAMIDQTNSCAYLFYYYEGDNVDFIAGLDTSNVTDMSSMFRNCGKLTTIPLLDTSNVTSMGGMFNGCSSLTTVPSLDTSNVTMINSMFDHCSSLTTIPLLDTSNVTNMSYMFQYCSNLISIPQLDTSNVTNMSYMFNGCSSLTTIPLLDTSNVTSMSNMFYDCMQITSIPQLNTSNVTSMSNMFRYCRSLTKISMLNIGTSLDISPCTKMTREALLEVLGNLKDLTNSTSKKLTLGSDLLAKLTEDDIAIATNKNWTLA